MIDFGTTSLLEMAVGCRNVATDKQEMWQQVGVAVAKDWVNTHYVNLGDSVLRVQVEFLTNGAGWTGIDKGGWEGFATNLEPAPGRLYAPGMAIFNPSIIGGPQFESRFEIRLWNGDWWVGWNGSWLGYYKSKTFGDQATSMLFSNACEALWYGEVYDATATPTKWTWTDMGSGQFASAGWRNAANFWNPSYTDLSGAPQWPDNAKDAPGNNPACYTKTALNSGTAPWDRFFYVGGPGGDAPNQDCPVPH